MRSIIEIDVETGNFLRFKEMFDQYQKSLQKTNQEWGSIGKKIGSAKSGLAKLAAESDKLVKDWSKADTYAKKFTLSLKVADRSVSSVAKGTGIIAKNITAASLALLKWSGITTAIGGLLGAGGLFGINRLAGNISGQQKFSSGVGISYGASQAFGPAFNRFLDSPDSLLSKMAEYKSSSKGMGEFAKMGISGYESKSADELAIEVMRKAADFYKKTPKNLLSDYAGKFGYSELFSTEELRRLGTSKDLSSRIGVFGSSKRSLNLAGGETGPYQNLKDTMAISGAGIEATFGRALAGLIPQLTKLSEAFRKAIDVFMRSDLVKGALGSLSDGIKTFAEYLKSPEFLNDMDEFLETMKKMALGFKKLLGFIPGVDMSPSIGLQMRKEERLRGLPSGTLAKAIAAGTLPGGKQSASLPGSLGFLASIYGNPQALPVDVIRSQVRAIIGNGYDNLDPRKLRVGTPVYNDAVNRRSAVDAATNRALVELKVINDTGGNAAVSINGMVAQ